MAAPATDQAQEVVEFDIEDFVKLLDLGDTAADANRWTKLYVSYGEDRSEDWRERAATWVAKLAPMFAERPDLAPTLHWTPAPEPFPTPEPKAPAPQAPAVGEDGRY